MQQAFTRTNVDTDLCQRMVFLGHNELMARLKMANL